jgi:hypothetical protein
LRTKNGNLVIFECTDRTFEQQAQRANELGRQAMIQTGCRVDPDSNLCAAQIDAARAGFLRARIDSNIYGFCVRDTMNDGAGRMSPNFATPTEALTWAREWHQQRPALREVICYVSFAGQLGIESEVQI